jgi:myo-inositol-1(or 4)-monophosphatase
MSACALHCSELADYAKRNMPLQDELAATVDIANQAAELVLSFFDTDRIDVQAKGIGDVVTAADTASEALIVSRLKSLFPDDGIVGEEGSNIGGKSGRTWYVDPLDGTLNFSRSLPLWCVSMALFEDDRPLLAVIRDPIRRETFSAQRGRGSYRNGARITSSRVENLADSVVHITVDLKDVGQRAGLDDIVSLSPRVLRTRNIGSAALALAYVAAGRFDAMLHRFAYPWDYAAGVLLVHEAGGVVTDLRGQAYTPRTHAVCAAASQPLATGFLTLLSRPE